MIAVTVVIASDSTGIDDPTPIPITAARGQRVASTATAAPVRLRLRAWEARRRFAGRAVIAASFPIAYLLLMGADAPAVAVRVVLGLWLGAVSAAIVCAEAVWRHRYRLEHGPVAGPASTIGPVP
jgi:hypothetical protein